MRPHNALDYKTPPSGRINRPNSLLLTEDFLGSRSEVIKRSDNAQGFELLSQRWIVERSFGWMNTYRRLSKDYEGHVKLSRA